MRFNHLRQLCRVLCCKFWQDANDHLIVLQHVKARMRLLEVLVSKHEHRREI